MNECSCLIVIVYRGLTKFGQVKENLDLVQSWKNCVSSTRSKHYPSLYFLS